MHDPLYLIHHLKQLWEHLVPGYWVTLTWVLSAAGWALMALLWIIQTRWAAQDTRWPAMYVHAFKAVSAFGFALFFFLSLVWREPGVLVMMSNLLRNFAGLSTILALFFETVWRMGQTPRRPHEALS